MQYQEVKVKKGQFSVYFGLECRNQDWAQRVKLTKFFLDHRHLWWLKKPICWFSICKMLNVTVRMSKIAAMLFWFCDVIFFFFSLKGFVKLWLSERSSHENISFLRKELEDLAKKKKERQKRIKIIFYQWTPNQLKSQTFAHLSALGNPFVLIPAPAVFTCKWRLKGNKFTRNFLDQLKNFLLRTNIVAAALRVHSS